MPDITMPARQLRDVFGAFVTGVTVVTTLDGAGRAHGLTANSFSSVSLDPPLVLWSQALSAPSYPAFRDAERFAINILSEDQIDVSTRFAQARADKFAGLATRPGLGDVPLIEGCAATIECVRKSTFPGGDHAIFLGGVERIERHPRRSLAFGAGRYLIAHPHRLGGRDTAVEHVAHVHAVRMATPVVADLCCELDETLCLSVWGNHGPTVIRWEEASRPVSPRLRTGVVLPLLGSATGLLFAALLPPPQTAALLAAEQVATGTDTLTAEAALATVREQGHARLHTDALAELHVSPVAALSVPVFDASGIVTLAITAVRRRSDEPAGWADALAPRLEAAASELSRRLGAA